MDYLVRRFCVDDESIQGSNITKVDRPCTNGFLLKLQPALLQWTRLKSEPQDPKHIDFMKILWLEFEGGFCLTKCWFINRSIK